MTEGGQHQRKFIKKNLINKKDTKEQEIRTDHEKLISEDINDNNIELIADKETELKDFFDNNKVSVSSNGVLYRSDKKGLIPALLEKWFDTRVEYRKLMKKFGDAGDNEKYTYFKQSPYFEDLSKICCQKFLLQNYPCF